MYADAGEEEACDGVLCEEWELAGWWVNGMVGKEGPRRRLRL